MVETYHRRHRRKNVTITELPYDVFYNILLRLPVRSLICCLCVTKQWQSIIKSPIFANIHLKHSDHQNLHKLLVLYRNIPCTFSIFDCETLEVGPCRYVPFEVIDGLIWFKSSCNGLVLVTLKKDRDNKMLSGLVLWNPLTGDYKAMTTKPKYYKEFYNVKGVIEMYYNSSEEDYRLLRITHRHNVYIYSLKSDTWRRIKCEDAFQSLPNLISERWLAGTCWNGNLYFNTHVNKSVRFDIKTEKFTVIEIPFIQNRQYSKLTVQRGCMYLCVMHAIAKREECMVLLKMNKDGDWDKVSTYTYDRYQHSILKPFHLMRDGNWLMKSMRNRDEIYKVDLENKHNEGSPRLYNINGHWEEGKYIETFVSPNDSCLDTTLNDGGSKGISGSRKSTRIVKRPARFDD